MTHLNIQKIGHGFPLVLIHGWGWNIHIWDYLLPYLSDKFELFLIDLPGHGKSPDMNPFTWDKLIQTLLLNLPKKAAWLGWSLGGMASWWVGVHYPERISALITVTSTPKFLEETDWPGVTHQAGEKFSTSLLEHYQKTLEGFLNLQLQGAPHYDALIKELHPRLFKNPPTLLGLEGALKLLYQTDLRSDLKKIMCPALYFFGNLDKLIPLAAIPKIQALSPNAQIEIIPHAGHMPFLTHPAIFTEKLIYFLESNISSV